jgi:hypothetical protein
MVTLQTQAGLACGLRLDANSPARRSFVSRSTMMGTNVHTDAFGWDEVKRLGGPLNRLTLIWPFHRR